MAHPIPPELMSPEDRQARLEWLRKRIRIEWVRFAVLTMVFINVPFVAVAILFGTDTISRRTMFGLIVLLGLVNLAYTLYMLRRVKPLGREHAALEELEATQ